MTMGINGLPFTANPEGSNTYPMTPELQLVLCLNWAKQRLNNSKVSTAERLQAIFSDLAQHVSMSKVSVSGLSAPNIESAARQLTLLAAPILEQEGMTRSFSILENLASSHPQTPVVVIVRTERGFAYPVVAYKSGGGIFGAYKHIYIFLPLCGEIKMELKNASARLRDGIVLSFSQVGKPCGFRAYTIATDNDPVLHVVENSLYGAVGGEEHAYQTIEPAADSRPIPPRRPPSMLPHERDPEDPGYALVVRKKK